MGGITQLFLKRPEWTVPTTDSDSNSLHAQRDKGRTEHSMSATRQSASPNVSDTAQPDHRDQRMAGSECFGALTQV